jgi:hypothetical protein
MRRTCSTQQAAAKVDAKTRSDILGHSVVVDENEYVQTPCEVKKDAMKKLEEQLVH